MPIAFDVHKSATNLAKHGLELSQFWGFDAEPMPVALIDDRRDYGEIRHRAFGRINGVGHMIAYTVRGAELWLISFRRAHEKEMKKYGI
jgi:uncharacterized protein